MEDLAKKTLSQIKEKKIKPIPRWCYCGARCACWGGTGLVVLAGALAGSLIVYAFTELDWEAIDYRRGEGWQMLLSLLPYFWLAVAAVSLVAAMVLFHSTGYGYRYEMGQVGAFVLGSVIGVVVLFFFLNVHKKAHQILLAKIPFLQRTIHTREEQWLHPEYGLLAGEIVSAQASEFQLRDIGNWCCWVVEVGDNTVIKGRVILEPTNQVKVIGFRPSKEEFRFRAKEIRPWEGEIRAWQVKSRPETARAPFSP